jgi:hypothetical protein
MDSISTSYHLTTQEYKFRFAASERIGINLFEELLPRSQGQNMALTANMRIFLQTKQRGRLDLVEVSE